MEQPARCEVALPETEAFADMCGQTGTIRARELWDGTEPVSYTHLDVYKRQPLWYDGTSANSG